jgi:hypothetical protein
MYFYLWYVFRCTLIFIFRSVRCNSEYQVNVIKHVRYVAWAISSRAIVKIHLYMFKKKKKMSRHNGSLFGSVGPTVPRARSWAYLGFRNDNFPNIANYREVFFFSFFHGKIRACRKLRTILNMSWPNSRENYKLSRPLYWYLYGAENFGMSLWLHCTNIFHSLLLQVW